MDKELEIDGNPPRSKAWSDQISPTHAERIEVLSGKDSTAFCSLNHGSNALRINQTENAKKKRTEKKALIGENF